MNSTPLTLGSLVVALFDLARLGLPADVGRIAGRLGVESARIARGLALLAQQGLVDAERTRLTLAGLALAAQLDTERRARRAVTDDTSTHTPHTPSANDAPAHMAA
jgi:Mn-dependent DtxR family transcriptional regulator